MVGGVSVSINPVDLQVMISKTTEVSKIQAEENNRSQIQHHNTATTVEQQKEHELKQVNAREKTYEASINEKQEGQNGGKKRKKKQKKQQQKEKNEMLTLEDKGSKIDVRL